MIDAEEIRAWAAATKAAWELQPLVELRQGQKVQVGFELDLYARIPTDVPPGEQRRQAVYASWQRLREIAQSLVPAQGGEGRLEVDPFQAAGRLRADTGFAPEILLKARVFHAAGYFVPVVETDRDKLKPVEDRLAELGFKFRTW